MTKFVSHQALDAAYAYIADRADALVLCQGAPMSGAEAMTQVSLGGRMLCAAPVTNGLGAGDFAVMPGVSSGRRLVIAARDVESLEPGTADHLAIVSRHWRELLIATPLDVPQALEAGTTVSIEEFALEIADPA